MRSKVPHAPDRIRSLLIFAAGQRRAPRLPSGRQSQQRSAYRSNSTRQSSCAEIDLEHLLLELAPAYWTIEEKL